MPAYPSASSFAVEDDGGSVASMTSLASKDSQVRRQCCSSPACLFARLKGFLRFPWQCVFSAQVRHPTLFSSSDLAVLCRWWLSCTLKSLKNRFGRTTTPVLSSASRPHVSIRVCAVEGHGIFQFEILGIERCSLHQRLSDPATALVVCFHKPVCTKPTAARLFCNDPDHYLTRSILRDFRTHALYPSTKGIGQLSIKIPLQASFFLAWASHV